MVKNDLKAEVLLKTRYGLLFYKFVIKNLELLNSEHCKNTFNPFIRDKNGDFNVYFQDGIWKFKDFGDEKYVGDLFTFAAFYFKLNLHVDFTEILRRMLEIDYSAIKIDWKEPKTGESKPVSNYKLLTVPDDQFRQVELDYFAQFGITLSLLEEYNVIPVKGYVRYQDGKAIEKKVRTMKSPMFAYPYKGGAKIYRPLEDKKYRFRHVGNIPKQYLFGYNQLFESDLPFAFITGGEKDVLTLAGLGYRAFCLNSETAQFSYELYRELQDDKVTVYSLLDFDDTGRKQSKKLKEELDIPIFEISEKYIKGKDISDFVKSGLTKKRFDILVKRFLKRDQKSSKVEVKSNKEDSLFFEQDLFDSLPGLLQDCIRHFDSPQDKSLILISAISVIGGLLPNIRMIYDRKKVAPNLFLFVIAPPASGKGNMNFCRLLGNRTHNELYEESKAGNDDAPIRTHFIPANSSSAAIITQLNNNDGIATIFDTEADTLTESLGKEWGNFSDLLRKAYSNERYELQRKVAKEYVNITYPYLSVVLSGTPNQVPRLINNTENGLFSRLLFFCFQPSMKWNDRLHIEEEGVDLDEHFENLGNELYIFRRKLVDLPNPIKFTFQTSDWDIFHSYFKEQFQSALDLYGEGLRASITRLATMTGKIAMIISAVRILRENKEIPNKIVCTSEDFAISLLMIKTLWQHTIIVYETMMNGNDRLKFSNENQRGFYQNLPYKFTRAEANEVAISLGLNLDTIDSYLTKWVKIGYLKRLEHKVYAKVG